MNKKNTDLVTNLVLVAALMLASLAPELNAQQPPVRKAEAKRTLKVLQGFVDQIREIDELLLADNNKKAYREASRLIRRISDIYISGPNVGRFLGWATVLRAIAAYHLGHEAEALWHWHVATQMFPDILNYQMTAYEDAGQFFRDHTLPQEVPEFEDASVPEIKPPQKKRSPLPKVPAAKRGGARVSITVQVIIGKDGRVRQPRILISQGELTMIWATLEALRKWEFKPALVDGKPAEASYNLTVNFNP